MAVTILANPAAAIGAAELLQVIPIRMGEAAAVVTLQDLIVCANYG